MSTQTILTKIRADHQPHSMNQAEACDACRLLDMVDKRNDAIGRCLEWISKSQIDPISMSQTLLEAVR
jgi:hypothetical protein